MPFSLPLQLALAAAQGLPRRRPFFRRCAGQQLRREPITFGGEEVILIALIAFHDGATLVVAVQLIKT